jgi:uncharacterized phage protein (TIGR02220 family)
MAERRMFAKSIVLSDAFLDMPMSARCLYFTLGMLADDDGFVGSPKAIMRQCGASEDDMRILVSKKYVLGFDSGVIVIKHWRLNNYLRNDRHVQTTYTEELDTLGIDDKGAYTQNVEKMERLPVGIPNDNQVVGSRYTQDRIGKDSIDNNIYSRAEDSPTARPEQADVTEVVEYLNQAAGTSFKKNTPKTVRAVKARMKEGFTVEDFKAVIDKKVREWKGTDMQKYIRPETLFGTKFEGYLNQQIVKGKAPPGSFNRMESRNYSKEDFAELERIALGGES